MLTMIKIIKFIKFHLRKNILRITTSIIKYLCLNTIPSWEEIVEIFKTFFPTLNLRSIDEIYKEEIEDKAKLLEKVYKDIENKTEELDKEEMENQKTRTRIELISTWYKQNLKIKIIDPLVYGDAEHTTVNFFYGLSCLSGYALGYCILGTIYPPPESIMTLGVSSVFFNWFLQKIAQGWVTEQMERDYGYETENSDNKAKIILTGLNVAIWIGFTLYKIFLE